MSGAPRTTARMRLCVPDQADAPAVHRFQGDPEAMQYTFRAPDLDATRRHLRVHEARRVQDGFAPWVLRMRESDEVIGWGGLAIDPDDPEYGPEVVTIFAPEVWGQGYATELVRASLEVAFGELGLGWVGAFTRPANVASARVLEKCGFVRVEYVARLERNRFRCEPPSSA